MEFTMRDRPRPHRPRAGTSARRARRLTALELGTVQAQHRPRLRTDGPAVRHFGGHDPVAGSDSADSVLPARPHRTAERLCDAADAALRATVEVGVERGEWLHPLDILDSPHRPSYMSGFTPREIERASEFLARLGMIAPSARSRPRPNGADRDRTGNP